MDSSTRIGVGTALTAVLALGAAGACGQDDPVDVDAGIELDAGPSPIDEIGFVAGDPLPAGTWLLANEWAGTPNQVGSQNNN